MLEYRKNAAAAGTLFLTAMAASLIGGGILESVLNSPDFPAALSEEKAAVFAGAALEMINAAAVIGIAAALFPVLKRKDESMTAGYLGFRVAEGAFCAIGAVIPLSLTAVSSAFINSDAANAAYYQTAVSVLKSIRTDLSGILIPVFFGIGALIFYYLLFRSRLVPRYVSVWGFAGAVMILALVFVKAAMVLNIILVMPIITNEIFLGIRLIIKGFDNAAEEN